MTLALMALVGGVALLGFAADQFVLGAARIALIARISPLVVGVVIVGFGTSAPEMLVSALAAAGDEPAVAVGNIVGSNIANLTLLLGVGAILVPLTVDSRTVRREGPLTVVAMGAFAIAVQGGGVSWPEGLGLFVLMAATLSIVMRRSPNDTLAADVAEFADVPAHGLRQEVLRTVLGLVGTVGGAQLLLWGALDLADRAGLEEGFVGATMVAVGTSLPELVTVIQSARRNEADLIVGNLLGSNLFNALAVGGLIGVIGTDGLDSVALSTFGSLAALGAAALAVVAMGTGHVVTRREGIALVVGYGALVPFLA
ncbi:MAG: sodium:calcium antiporter [Acidimicrobiales bacterium]